MSSNQSRNSGPKRRTRAYAQEHGLTYQQALLTLRGDEKKQRQTRTPSLSIPVGSQILIDHTHYGDAGYSLAAELEWTLFADETSSCVFIAPHDQLGVATLCHQLCTNPATPVESVLNVSTWGVEQFTETAWIAEEGRRGAWRFQQFVMANEEVGYAQAGSAADAVARFRPKPGHLGVVVINMSDPYEWAQAGSVGPHWCESSYRQQPGQRGELGEIKHVLSDHEQNDYSRFLREVDRLLERASGEGIVVLISVEDNNWDACEFLSRCGAERFGTRLFNGVHTEYGNQPTISHPEVFQAMFTGAALPNLPPPDDRYFWSGMEPKAGRIGYALIPGGAAPRLNLLLLRDPAKPPPYWVSTYQGLRNGHTIQ